MDKYGKKIPQMRRLFTPLRIDLESMNKKQETNLRDISHLFANVALNEIRIYFVHRILTPKHCVKLKNMENPKC